MSLYNELLVDEGGHPFSVQFRYGRCWQYTYRIGDQISWEGLKRPEAASGRVVVAGIGGGEVDNDEFHYYAVAIENDVIKSIHEISENEYDRIRENVTD